MDPPFAQRRKKADKAKEKKAHNPYSSKHVRLITKQATSDKPSKMHRPNQIS
jgi:hypothetical protein